MATYLRQTPPLWFRIVAILLLLWAAQGVFATVQQFRLGADAMGPASDYDRALYASMPFWYNWVFAVATSTALLGALALLMRSGLAGTLYLISLIAVTVQFGWLFATTDILAVKGPAATLPFPAFIVAVAAFSLWFAGFARRRGWIS